MTLRCPLETVTIAADPKSVNAAAVLLFPLAGASVIIAGRFWLSRRVIEGTQHGGQRRFIADAEQAGGTGDNAAGRPAGAGAAALHQSFQLHRPASAGRGRTAH